MENTQSITEMLAEDDRRLACLTTGFDPVTGEGSVGPRRRVELWLDADGPRPYYLPCSMAGHPLVKALTGRRATAKQAADIDALRMQHDFAYWAATRAYVKPKGGGDDVPLRLNHAQRVLIEAIERQRLAGRPLRIVLLKARQWGGSTAIQIYMAWLQLVRHRGLNSLIIAHQGCATDEIKDMYDRMLDRYPAELLGLEGNAKKAEGVGRSRAACRVPARNCKIKLGTAEKPDSCRGGDYSLVHLSEVALWRQTLGHKPEDIVRSACSGVLHRPETMIAYESTANGVGNFFHREYLAARDNPSSQFEAVFVAWHQIEQNALPFADQAEREAFARELLEGRHSQHVPSDRQESGAYLWGLWQRGATLEGINWYAMERTKHTSHASMAAECPTDDVEAFARSGANVFSADDVERLRAGCRPPAWVGDVAGQAIKGEGALRDVRFVSGTGLLEVWAKPDATCALADRYLTVVDIGGRSAKADWSVVAVFDRAPLASGGVPELVAQWRGHVDMDLLAWKAAQIAAYYHQALLVIESNTLETHDAERQVDGDQSHYILYQLRRAYPRLYARKPSPDDVRQGRPRRYGFHTNVSTKPVIISTLVEAVREGLYAERDERCLAELLTYERRPNGSYAAIEGAHDDLLMTRAIALHISATEMPIPAPAPDWSALEASSLF